MKASLRESVISYLKEEKLFGDKEIVFEFLKYLEAYCAELNFTEEDILLNDERYESVYNLFDAIILKSKPELTL